MLINGDEYTMISTCGYLGDLKFLMNELLDNMFVAAFLEHADINRCKDGFKVNTTYKNKH